MATTRSFSLLGFATQRITLRAAMLYLGAICLAAWCLVGAYLVVAGSVRLLPNPYDNTYPESSQLYAAVEGARIGHIYLPLYTAPYVVQPYGPLFYIVNIAIARAAHLSLDLARLEIRAFTFACFLLCGLVAYAIVRKMKQPRLVALLAGLALLAQPYFIAWNATVRPDMLCLLLMLLALFFAAGEEPIPASACCLAGFCGGLAFLVKQPGAAALVAIVVVLLLRKEFRKTLILILSAAAPVIVTFAFLLIRRESFLDQFASVSKNLWSLASGAQFIAGTADIRVLVALAIGAVALPRAFQSGRGAQIIAAFTLLTLALGLSGMPQVGADVNYYLPPLAGCALLLPFCIDELQKRSGHPIVLAIAVFALLSSLSAGVTAQGALAGRRIPSAQSNPYAQLASFRILSDRPFFTVHGRDPELLDPFTIHGLEVAGHWDSAPIVASLRHSDYDLIIFGCTGLSRVVCNFRGLSYFSPAVVAAINENYSVFCTTLAARVLVPRSRAIDVTPQILAPALSQPCGLGMHGKPPNLIFPATLK